jgi:phosphate:Na+ symporter
MGQRHQGSLAGAVKHVLALILERSLPEIDCLTALLQSSTATALITISFTAEGLVSLVPALAIMLGANVGTTLIVQILSSNVSWLAPVLFVLGLVAFRSGARSRIKDIGRVSIGLGLMLLALHILLDTLAPAENAPGVRVFMNDFNVATAVIFIGLLDTMARLLKKLLPNRVRETDPSRPRYLDESALVTPSLALADAARETLHMGDLVEIMLRKVMAAMMANDRSLVDQVSKMDNSVDNLDEAIKLYVTKLTRGSLDEHEGRRAKSELAALPLAGRRT